MISFGKAITFAFVTFSFVGAEQVDAQCFRNFLGRFRGNCAQDYCQPNSFGGCYSTPCYPDVYGNGCGSCEVVETNPRYSNDPVTQELRDIKATLQEIQKGANPDPLDPSKPNLEKIQRELDEIKRMLQGGSTGGMTKMSPRRFNSYPIVASLGVLQSKLRRASAKLSNAYPQSRTWRDHTGHFSTEGWMISVNDTEVQILKTSGKICTVTKNRLSARDIEYVVDNWQPNRDIQINYQDFVASQ